jgi:hypothetical protein
MVNVLTPGGIGKLESTTVEKLLIKLFVKALRHFNNLKLELDVAKGVAHRTSVGKKGRNSRVFKP